MKQLNNRLIVLSQLSASAENITLCILHQVAGWEKEALETFDARYRMRIRKVLAGDKSAIKEAEKTTKAMGVELDAEVENDGSPMTVYMIKCWEACMMCVFATLSESNDPAAINAVYSDYKEWIAATQPTADREIYNNAYELLNETLRYIGREEVRY